MLWRLAPLGLAVVLYVLNNIAVLTGWLWPPEGFAAVFWFRGTDFAQYLTWLNGYATRTVLPDFHAAWSTGAVFFNPLFWLIARGSRLQGVGAIAGYHAMHFLLYVSAAYALAWALRLFVRDRWLIVVAVVAIVCAIPLRSLGVLPALLSPRREPPWLPGLNDFVWWSSDGFCHGLCGSLLVTFGTAATLITFCCLAAYLNGNGKRFLLYASVATAISAWVHPFEVFVVVPAGSIALLCAARWSAGIRAAALLCGAGGIGLLPHALAVLKHPWLRDVAAQNRWWPGPPTNLLMVLGLPTLVCIALLIAQPRRFRAPTDTLLLWWFLCALVGLYVPWIPWSQHLMSGFHVAVGMLLARQVGQSRLLTGLLFRRLGAAVTAACILCFASVVAFGAYVLQSARDGCSASPQRLFATVAPAAELALIDWFRQHADAKQLVLAPPEMAPWLATVPIHSFASHWLFSVRYADQIRVSRRFYGGGLEMPEAHALLTDYGIRYVIADACVVRHGYLTGCQRRFAHGAWTVFECPALSIKSSEPRMTTPG